MKAVPLLLLIIIAIGVTTQSFTCFPRMRDTPSILPYERRMPEMPVGTVPFAKDTPCPTSPNVAPSPPIPSSPQSITLGSYYYQYYCQMCHGPGGNGNGSVGHSYVPIPPALATTRVKGMVATDLTKIMVTGVGHEPVMDTTVPDDRRWHIANYLQSLAPVTPPTYPPGLAEPETIENRK